MFSIPDIILGNNQRGVGALRHHLPQDYCDQAARLVLSSPGTTLIATGFYITMADAPETDGAAGGPGPGKGPGGPGTQRLIR